MNVTHQQLLLIGKAITGHRQEYLQLFRALSAAIAENYVPAKAQQYADRFLDLHKRVQLLSQGDEANLKRLDDVDAPLLRDALASERLRLAAHLDAKRPLTTDPALLRSLDDQIRPFDELLSTPWARDALPSDIPRLADFYPIERVEQAEAMLYEQMTGRKLDPREAKPEPRAYDEKFRILQAPTPFLPDLHAAREAATMRGIQLAVAFVDIDHFKSYNSDHTETVVDQLVLPNFMRALEAHVYSRGHAYRFGGDEYLVILNNVTEAEALDSTERLRQRLAALKYDGVKGQVTVSIGVAMVRPDCHLIGREVQKAANDAKEFAKAGGRNRVATYRRQTLQAADLYVASPPHSSPA